MAQTRGQRAAAQASKGLENVYLFVPNLIGFARVFLALGALWTANDDPVTTFWLYFWSCFLDAWDGHAARYFNQSTKFGAVLDMVTDRCTTTCMLVQLACFYGERDGKKEYTFLFQFLIALDISSHWIHMYTTLSKGGASHKEVTNPLLKMYYYKPVLFTMCAANDGFFACLYALYHKFDGPEVPFLDMGIIKALAYLCFPFCALKQLTNLIQLVNAANDLAEMDAKERAAKSS